MYTNRFLAFLSDYVNQFVTPVIVDNDKLTNPNFDCWYQRLRIILEYEWILYVIRDPVPEQLAPNVHTAIKDIYQK